MSNLPLSGEQPWETEAKTAYDHDPESGCGKRRGPQGLSLEDELASYQLVGEVTAHQGF